MMHRIGAGVEGLHRGDADFGCGDGTPGIV
jgi:hypothetical protein